MRSGRSSCPGLLSSAVLILLLLHTLYSILYAPPIFPKVSNPAATPVVTSLCENTWLKRVHSYNIFSSRRDSTEYRVRLPHGSLFSSISSKAMFSFKFVPRHFSWYILTRDDSYVLVDDLLQDLSAFDADESYMAVIGAKSLQDLALRSPHTLVVASRGAMISIWRNIFRGRDDCTVRGPVEQCLSDVVQLNLQQDIHQRRRFHVMERHFAPKEMSQYTATHGGYVDDVQAFSSLSDSLISLHNLTLADMRIFDLLLNRIKVLPQL
ncbi:hypothetical protein Q1695_016124 [Nippostrongylus brasiliensis]|nr:hypothetical protein Q1695_016124 [Nippostrongylus brasiliensis]